jgi:hypothetical protein
MKPFDGNSRSIEQAGEVDCPSIGCAARLAEVNNNTKEIDPLRQQRPFPPLPCLQTSFFLAIVCITNPESRLSNRLIRKKKNNRSQF